MTLERALAVAAKGDNATIAEVKEALPVLFDRLIAVERERCQK